MRAFGRAVRQSAQEAFVQHDRVRSDGQRHQPINGSQHPRTDAVAVYAVEIVATYCLVSGVATALIHLSTIMLLVLVVSKMLRLYIPFMPEIA